MCSGAFIGLFLNIPQAAKAFGLRMGDGADDTTVFASPGLARGSDGVPDEVVELKH